ncbi:MAG: glucose-6-phosphate dehydrogenase [Bacteroidales bacterium]|jgi:glucose-6-phosphate 1-dehydrogenase
MKRPENLALIIFGASGDLTYRKLIPAVYSLKVQGLLPEKFEIIGVSRSKMSDIDFRKKIKEGIISFSGEKNIAEKDIDEFTYHLSYFTIDLDSEKDYEALKNFLIKKDNECGTAGNYVFYFATPPSMYTTIAENLSVSGLSDQTGGFRRIIFEKPFGYDLYSCQQLNARLHKLFTEPQIYRIDHYLGKETVQNLLVTRFSNGLFEPLWNRNYINHIEITSAESLGVENRGGYYESAGALRDMVQNHLLQMVGLTAMESPSSLNPDAIRNEVLKVFQSLQPIKEEEVEKYVIRGQYTASRVRGECLPAYRQEHGVDPNSRTETYVAIKFYINNWRWGGVPFYIRTGKRLPTKVTEIVIHFKPTPHFLFRNEDINKAVNQLIIRIQPDEGILLKFGMKEPGAGFNVKNVNMDFHYSDLADVKLPSAYERLLSDVMMGDSTLYSRDDTVETAWKFLEPIQTAWATNLDIKIFGYPAGTWGPENANDLIEGKDLTWRYPCKNLADDGLYCEL